MRKKGRWKQYKPEKHSPVNQIIDIPKDIVDVEEKLNQIKQKESLIGYVDCLKWIYFSRLCISEDIDEKLDEIVSYLSYICENKEKYLKSIVDLASKSLKYITNLIIY